MAVSMREPKITVNAKIPHILEQRMRIRLAYDNIPHQQRIINALEMYMDFLDGKTWRAVEKIKPPDYVEPIKPIKKSKSKYPFFTMAVGENYIGDKSAFNASRVYAGRLGIKFSWEKTGNQWKITRIQ